MPSLNVADSHTFEHLGSLVLNGACDSPHEVLASLFPVVHDLAHSKVNKLDAAGLSVVKNVVGLQIAMTDAGIVDEHHCFH